MYFFFSPVADILDRQYASRLKEAEMCRLLREKNDA